MLDDFGTEDTYKLYRTIYEIIHPTISKKNISNYKIILQEDLIPLRIFYPKKISKLEKAVIYIPGKSWIVNGIKNYSEVAIELSKKYTFTYCLPNVSRISVLKFILLCISVPIIIVPLLCSTYSDLSPF